MDYLLGGWNLAVNYVVPFLIVLTVVVFVHELGHYWIARRNGVKVEVFSVGFGAELLGWTDKHQTRWRISAIPFGGYVKMFGDADPASTPDTEIEMTEAEKAVSFHHKNLAQKSAIVAAGPLANFAFAILVFAAVFVFLGRPVTPPVVGAVQPGSAAEKSGLRPGDIILKIDGKKVDRFTQVQDAVRSNFGSPLAIVVDRGGIETEMKAVPVVTELADRFGNVHKVPILGINVSLEGTRTEYLNPLEAIWAAIEHTWNLTVKTLEYLWNVIIGVKGTEEIGGPLRIAKVSGEMSQTGVVETIIFIAVLSVNLGLINLFPIPLLDGGHLFFYFIEAVIRRPLREEIREIGFRIGLFLVFALMIFATWNDLVHLKVWDYFKGLWS